MTPDIFPDKVEAKCELCGHIWPYHRHEALACPFCNACFESVQFTGGKKMAFFAGRWWRDILKEQAKVEAKTLPEHCTKYSAEPLT